MTPAKTAVALGLFDGVHLGHRAVINAASKQRKKGMIPAVFTFSPESALYKSDSDSGYIYGNDAKKRLISECGTERICSPGFDSVCRLSGAEFVLRVLRERLNAAYVCCGKDFRFGNGASCGADELKDFGRKFGFAVEIVEDVRLGDSVVSSSEIRRLLKEGSIGKANELLGKPYTISGTVADGNHIGRTIDFPTVNQNFSEGQLVPAYGAYSGSICIDGALYRTVTNIGIKPTIEGERRPLAETHILGFSGDLYGKDISVELRSFLRSEKKFSSLDELKAQIAEDIRISANDI
jgi:riboflavin kinase/FMN adenylyltransferase